jgi:hypothetical protein
MTARTRLQLSVQEDVLRLLRRLAEQQHRSLSNTVEYLIREHAAKQRHD